MKNIPYFLPVVYIPYMLPLWSYTMVELGDYASAEGLLFILLNMMECGKDNTSRSNL